MKQYIVTVISFAVIFFITMVVTNMILVLFMPTGVYNAWEVAGQHSSQVVAYDSFSMVPIIISAVVALLVSYFFYRKFATTTS
ncbi:hypothetical protein ACFOLA_00950 [Salinicoccus hispanicus]|uniref:Uncharacterized protein n=1 Tax=Salinicoccus hispanicus TaxID=157225 RepID=A0A6N8TXI1_9STAP|nr:hypothetical protein [Salinicoccus hispanicus]MXQ50152.1 hypothetical protein [Salinicoccus hispanicus]